MPLAQKFVFAVVCLILIIMIAVNSLVVTSQRAALRTEMENSHLLVIRNLAKDVIEPLMVLDPLRLDEHLQVTVQAPASFPSECSIARSHCGPYRPETAWHGLVIEEQATGCGRL